MFLAALVLSLLTAEPRQWNDTIRDVYVDGRQLRGTQTLVTASGPRLVAVVCGEEVLLFDPEAKTVTQASLADFVFSKDRLTATSSSEPAPAGTFVQPDPSTFLAELDGKSVLVTSHQSQAGTMTVDELWQTVPVWKAIAETYEPDPAVLERLRAVQTPTRLQVVLATWCGDSKKYVPRLMKSVAVANNPNLTIELVGIGAEFDEPMEVVQGLNITNVPTVLVLQGETEVGRFVETPAAASVEQDVADILVGAPKPHPGRIERGALLSSGTRRVRGGREKWELYERPKGGTIVHSVITRRDRTRVETWTSVDPARKVLSAEVTRRGELGTTRTRYRRDGAKLHATTRGTDGLIQQTVLVPEDVAIVTPASITETWAKGKKTYVVAEAR